MDKIDMNSKAICILGMHRSGTSTITRAVKLIGAYLGEKSDLIEPAPDNPEGFWERNDIVDLNDRILHHLKRSWDTSLPLPDKWHLSDDLRPYRKEIAELVNEKFSGRELWAWKDPRTTVLFDIWREALKGSGVNLVCLFAVRNPLDVAKSLEKRNGLPLDKGLGVWFNYNISALKSSAHMDRVFISYDRFLAGWETEIRRCASGLGIPWPEDDTALKEKMREFIHPEFRHSFSGLNELKDSGAPSPVIELYTLLKEVMDPAAPSARFDEEVERLADGFSTYARFFDYDIKRSWEVDQQLSELNRQLMDMQRQLARKDLQIQTLRSSPSWKITAPLRGLAKLFRQGN